MAWNSSSNIFDLLEEGVEDVERFPKMIEKRPTTKYKRNPKEVIFDPNAPNILYLERDMIREVFKYLSGRQICALTSVCKHFKRLVERIIADTPHIWENWLNTDFDHISMGRRTSKKLKKHGTAYYKEIYITKFIHEKGIIENSKKRDQLRDIRFEIINLALSKYILKLWQKGDDSVDRFVLTCPHKFQYSSTFPCCFGHHRNCVCFKCEVCCFKGFLTKHRYLTLEENVIKYQLKEPSESQIADCAKSLHKRFERSKQIY